MVEHEGDKSQMTTQNHDTKPRPEQSMQRIQRGSEDTADPPEDLVATNSLTDTQTPLSQTAASPAAVTIRIPGQSHTTVLPFR